MIPMANLSKPGIFLDSLDKEQKERLFQNIATAMDGVPMHIVERQLAHFDKADTDYGNGVRNALNLSLDLDA